MMGHSIRLSIILCLTLLALVILSLFAGLEGLLQTGALRNNAWLILVELRFPRTVLALVVGAALGLSGAVLQGYLRNPLADAAIVGVSSSAALGAILTIYYGLSGISSWGTPTAAMMGASVALILLYILAGANSNVTAFLLAGMIVNSLVGSLIAMALSLAATPFALSEMTTWMLGSLADRTLEDLAFVTPFWILGMGIMFSTGRALAALSLGEAAAASLGVSLGRLRLMMVLGVGLAVGSSVSVSGVIGFVGLVVPHLVRPLVDHRPEAVLVPSALGGALLLLLADIVLRFIPAFSDVRLGVITALLGAPFFLVLMMRLRRVVL